MKLVVCAVLDNAAKAFGRPIFVATTGLAIRQFIDEVNRVADDNVMNQHPRDFALYRLAEFDDNLGTFENVPEKLMDGIAAITSEE